jgi:tetratricopeptide (TPR) repeat protein
MPLSSKTIQEIVEILSPFCESPAERKALLAQALGLEHKLYKQMDYSGNTQVFCVHFIDRTAAYGTDALGVTPLWLVLEFVANELVGADKQNKIAALRYEVNPGLKPPAPPLAAIPIEPPEPPEDDANPEIEAILEQIADAESIQMWSEVIELGEQILAINPKHKVARERIANAYYRRSQRYTYYNASVDALEDFTQAIEYDPNNPIYYFERGRLYWWRSRYRRAIKDFTSALELEPGNLQYLYWRGMCYLRCGNKEAAQIDFGSARQSA